MFPTHKQIRSIGGRCTIAILACFLFPNFSATAQPVDEILETIERLISTEDVPALVAMASDPLDIAAFGATQTYSRTQGMFVLRDLFDSEEVTSFKVADHSVSVNGLFVKGDVEVPPSARPIRIYVRLKWSSDQWSIREFLFERIKT